MGSPRTACDKSTSLELRTKSLSLFKKKDMVAEDISPHMELFWEAFVNLFS